MEYFDWDRLVLGVLERPRSDRSHLHSDLSLNAGGVRRSIKTRSGIDENIFTGGIVNDLSRSGVFNGIFE